MQAAEADAGTHEPEVEVDPTSGPNGAASSDESEDEQSEETLFQQELRRTAALRRAATAGGGEDAGSELAGARETEPLFAARLRNTEMLRRQQQAQEHNHHCLAKQQQQQPPARNAPKEGKAVTTEPEGGPHGRMATESIGALDLPEEDWVPTPAQAHSLGREQRARRAAARAAPVWVRSTDPELRVCAASPQKAACQLCTEPFGYLTRKHHCRHCGWAVCGTCSERSLVLERWLLPKKPHSISHTRSSAPQRVCDACYYELGPADTEGAADTEGGGTGSWKAGWGSGATPPPAEMRPPRTRAEMRRRRQLNQPHGAPPPLAAGQALGAPPAAFAPRLGGGDGRGVAQDKKLVDLERQRMATVARLSVNSFRRPPTASAQGLSASKAAGDGSGNGGVALAAQQQEGEAVAVELLTEPLFWLGTGEAKFCQMSGLGYLVPQLPRWVPHALVSRAVHGYSGEELMEKVIAQNGAFLWATEFGNVHTGFSFTETPFSAVEDEPPIPEPQQQLEAETETEPETEVEAEQEEQTVPETPSPNQNQIAGNAGEKETAGVGGLSRVQVYGGPEQYYQAARSVGTAQHGEALKLLPMAAAHEAAMVARRFPTRPDWSPQLQRRVMTEAVRAKFTQGPNSLVLLPVSVYSSHH